MAQSLLGVEMKLDINDIKRGSLVVMENTPYVVLSVKHVHMGRGSAVVQSKLKDLKTGKILEKSLRSSDDIEEAKIEKTAAQFIYERNGEYWLHEKGNPKNRFRIEGEAVGEEREFLKSNMEVKAYSFEGNIINIELPVKADYEVIDAPPNVRGNTSQGGNKVVTIEGGAKVSVPLFIEVGDIIRVNIEKGEYTERSG